MFGCNFHSFLVALIPDNRADAYFLIFILNMFILFAVHKSITELIMVIVDLVIFLIVKSVIYNNNDNQNRKVENIPNVSSGVSAVSEIRTIGSSIARMV
jgi:hypothetical protein